jgi:hypothetical protein
MKSDQNVRETQKKEWKDPDVAELALKETATGGAGASDGLDPGS